MRRRDKVAKSRWASRNTEASSHSSVNVRTLMLLGDKEFIYEPRAARVGARELMPDVETELVPNTGHLPNAEQADLVDSRLVDFLSRNGTDSQ